MNNNIFKILSNPKQYVIDIAKHSSNPILSNLINLVEQGKNNEAEQIVRNIYKENGKDFDKEYKALMSMIPRK